MLAPLAPSFVSVTYGAGGTTRKLTHEAVTTIGKNYGLAVAAHLTCVEATRAETLEIAETYAAEGVTEIVALRGDAPKGAGRFAPHPDGFADSVELIEALAATGKFTLRVGAYPGPASRGRRPAGRRPLAQAQDRGRGAGRHHPVLLRGRDLLCASATPAPTPASPPRSFPASCRSRTGTG